MQKANKSSTTVDKLCIESEVEGKAYENYLVTYFVDHCFHRHMSNAFQLVVDNQLWNQLRLRRKSNLVHVLIVKPYEAKHVDERCQSRDHKTVPATMCFIYE